MRSAARHYAERLWSFPARMRLPRRLSRADVASAPTARHPGDEGQLAADNEVLRAIAAGLDGLDQRLAETETIQRACRRGYFTPDEDDAVRQLLLAYRNYRLAGYELILRYLGYARLENPARQLQGFMLGFGAALTLYAKSLRLIQTAEHVPLLRSKLNEPDAKFELEAGSFDEVLAGYSSLANFRLLMRANWSWYRRRRLVRELRLWDSPEWRWVLDLIRQQRRAVRQRLTHVLAARLRYDWRMFCQTTVMPLRQSRYQFQALVGGAFASARVAPHYEPALNEAVLDQLHTQLRPGDVLLVRAEGKLTSALLPGFWAHAAIYLGDRRSLEPLGLAACPHASRHWHELPAVAQPRGCVIEAISPRVQISPLAKSLRADHVAVLRPNLPAGEIAAALEQVFGHCGKPYDFEFDFNRTSRIVCTELVYRGYHGRGGISFALVKRLGRFTLTGDDIMDYVLETMSDAHPPAALPFQLVALALKGAEPVARFVAPDEAAGALRRIQAGWRPARTEPEPSPAGAG